MIKSFYKIIGYVLSILSFYYIYLSIRKLDINDQEILNLITINNFYIISVSILVYIFVIYISAAYWTWLVQLFSKEEIKSNPSLINVYATSNVGKYLPGNFMQFVGRNILAKRLGYNHSTVFTATLFEVFYVLFVAAVILMMLQIFNLTLFSFSDILDNINVNYYLFLVPVVLIFVVRKQAIKLILEYQVFDYFIITLKSGVFRYFIVYLLLGFINYLILFILVGSINTIDYFNLLFIFIFSWIIGFLIPGAPGGIGIREAIFLMLMSQKYNLQVSTLLPLIFRVVNIVGDILFFIINKIKENDDLIQLEPNSKSLKK